ncbi:MAG: hypothetical protein ACYDB7_01780 [Mycobacteriales bacterium]
MVPEEEPGQGPGPATDPTDDPPGEEPAADSAADPPGEEPAVRVPGRDGIPAQLADLLAQGERAAFRGKPGDALAPLREALEAASFLEGRVEGLAAGWLLGVALGACGRYGEALTVLAPLSAEGAAGVGDRSAALFSALACATVASLHRQLGRHRDARVLDERGRGVATPLGAAGEEAVIDCALGLAADAVGLGEADVARRELAVAAEVIGARTEPGWRPSVRLDWVRAEVGLLEGDPGQAAADAARALRVAERARAPRHVAKSLLFLGVAQATAGDAAAAIPTLRRASVLAESLGAGPLVWPARAMLGALLEGTDAAESLRCLQAAADTVREIAAGLPEELRPDWLQRPDVAELLARN